MHQARKCTSRRHQISPPSPPVPGSSSYVKLNIAHSVAFDRQMMYAGADAFVLPTHGEGWGRPAVEAMAMSLPTIVTNWSGTSQFLSDTATYPIPVPELEDSKQGPGKWAKIDVPVLQALMREVESDRARSRQVGLAAREHILNHFDQRVVAKEVLDKIQTACLRQQNRPR